MSQLDHKSEAWSALFSEPMSDLVKRYTASVFFDKRLWQADNAGSLAHAAMLQKQGVISATDAADIRRGMEQIRQEIASGAFDWKLDLEDVHLNIEARLTQLVGDAGKRLHTGRSRNDQVATDVRLWLRGEIDLLVGLLADLQKALLTLAEQNVDVVMPGFTHLQVAQPVSFGHHMLAYVEMFARDQERMRDVRKRVNRLPLGAAALAGTSYPLDREFVAKELGMEGVCQNSLDAVSDRDFAIEFAAAASLAMVHISRLSEELVLWSSQTFGFIEIADRFTTGSSIMPQKRNPDAAELIRGKTGRVLGDFVALASVVKGLVLTYGTDLQEDKERVFDAADTLELCLAALAAMVADMTAQKDRMRAACEPGFPTATDLADWVVRVLKKPFREAHHIAGSIVKLAETKGVTLDKLPLAEMQSVEPAITQEVFKVLSPEASVASRMSLGGTAPARVKEQLHYWRSALK
jgi:argininosuccinate lyase